MLIGATESESENVHKAEDNDWTLNDEIDEYEGRVFMLLIVNFLPIWIPFTCSILRSYYYCVADVGTGHLPRISLLYGHVNK